jgi:nitrate reductase gamma subunit
MEVVRFIVGSILPYVAVAVFVVAMAYRFYVWKKLPSPPMTLFPAAETPGANRVNTLKEVTLFSSLFRGDRLLWSFAWVFHVVLALIFMGHLRVFANVDQVLMGAGMNEAGIQLMSSGVGGAAGVVVVVTALFLLVRRLLVKRVREITGYGDYLALLLIGAILITGNMMRFGAAHFDLSLTRDYFASLATFKGVGDAEVLSNNVFIVHMGLALVLMIYIPFSKILHFGGVFFTHQLIRRP